MRLAIVCFFLFLLSFSLSFVYSAPVRPIDINSPTDVPSPNDIRFSDDGHTPDVPIEARIPFFDTTSIPTHPKGRPFLPRIKNRIWQPKPVGTPTPTPTPSPTTPIPTTLAPTIAPTTPIPTTTPVPTTSPTTQQPTAKPPSTPITPSLTYHNGPLTKGIPKIWYVYYGNWTTLDPLAEPLITYFTSHLSESPLMNIMSTYYDNTGGQTAYLTNQIQYGGKYMDTSYSYGKSISDLQIYYIIKNAMTAGHIPPPDTVNNNIYFVLSSPDVAASSGLCTQYCGWHTAGSFTGGKAAPYGYIGSSIRCGGCMAFSSLGSPNNAPNADSMLSVIWHEITEALSDPYFTGWYDPNYYEIADVLSDLHLPTHFMSCLVVLIVMLMYLCLDVHGSMVWCGHL
jgi:hypothetical protein